MINLPSNIDLTENRDFGEHIGGHILLNFTLDETNIYPFEIYHKKIRIRHDKAGRYERILGTHTHNDETYRIFGLDNPENLFDEDICQRCGKKERAPWLKYQGLCSTCNYIIETGAERIPWLHLKEHKIERLHGDAVDVLNMK